MNNCKIGEVPKIYSTYFECFRCEKGFYSFDQIVCNKCPIGADCEGGSHLAVDKGYWRMGEYDDIVVEC